MTVGGAPDLPALVQDPPQLNVALEAYGRALFRFGRPRGELVNTILAIVDLRRELRRLLSPAWDFVELWRSFCPGANRIALPEIMLKAMTAVALQWNWYRTAAALRLCFYALLRPGEFLKALRKHLVLPSDLCRDPSRDSRVYLNIAAPKTRSSGARQQHARSDDILTQRLWQFLADGAAPDEKLWTSSPAVFRTKWNRICRHLHIPFNEVSGVTPASLRGGGASALYEYAEDTELVRHRGRWTSSKMVEIYIQEVGGHQFFSSLPVQVRSQIAALALREQEIGIATLSRLSGQVYR